MMISLALAFPSLVMGCNISGEVGSQPHVKLQLAEGRQWGHNAFQRLVKEKPHDREVNLQLAWGMQDNCVICNESYENDLDNCPTEYVGKWHVPLGTSGTPQITILEDYLPKKDWRIPTRWGWNPLVTIGSGQCQIAKFGAESQVHASKWPQVPGIVHSQCWVNYYMKLRSQGKPVTCPNPTCNLECHSRGSAGMFGTNWNISQEHEKQVEFRLQIEKTSAPPTPRRKRSRSRRKRSASRSFREFREALKKNKEIRKNKAKPAPKKPEGFGYRKRFSQFWHSWKGKANPRY